MDRATIAESPEDAFDVRMHMLNKAEKNLDISYYSTHWNESTKIFFGGILDAADRGVKVRLILDGMFSGLKDNALNAAYALGLHPNIEIKLYNAPNLLMPWTLNGRLHDKYIIVDNELLLLGGRNIGDVYYDLGNYKKDLNLDRDVFVYNTAENTAGNKESVIYEVKQYFENIWDHDFSKVNFEQAKGEQIDKAKEEGAFLRDKLLGFKEERPEVFIKNIDYTAYTLPTNKISLISNPTNITRKEPLLWFQLHELMKEAEERIKLQSPYIVLSKPMKEDIKEVAQTVEDFTLQINSVASCANPPAFSDYKNSRDSILDTGINIHEYQGEDSLHGKSMLVDDDLSVVGSFNLDMRSAYIDTEVMLVVHGKEFNKLLENNMMNYEKQSIEVGKNNEYVETSNIDKREISQDKKNFIHILSYFSWMIRFLI